MPYWSQSRMGTLVENDKKASVTIKSSLYSHGRMSNLEGDGLQQQKTLLDASLSEAWLSLCGWKVLSTRSSDTTWFCRLNSMWVNSTVSLCRHGFQWVSHDCGKNRVFPTIHLFWFKSPVVYNHQCDTPTSVLTQHNTPPSGWINKPGRVCINGSYHICENTAAGGWCKGCGGVFLVRFVLHCINEA